MKILLICTVFIRVIGLTMQQPVEGAHSSHEARLLKTLFIDSGYNPLIRPVQRPNKTICVGFNIQLSQVIAVDEKNMVMKTNVWLQMDWFDYQLSWDKQEYGGDLESIRVYPDNVWTPDIVLFNNADGDYEVSYKSNVVIYANGYINWIPPAIFVSSCSIDVEYFPFDQQVCEMKFGSWTYNANQLNYIYYKSIDIADLTDYYLSGTWIVVEVPAKVIREEDKSVFIFKFTLRRMTLFYIVNLIIPCILISFVSICVFSLPADACEKITLCISMLLVLVVFLLLISKILPPTLTIPLIAKYLLFTFVMNSFAIVLTVVVININFRTPRTHRMPHIIRMLFLNYLPRLMKMKRPDHDNRWQKPDKTPKVTTYEAPDIQPSPPPDLAESPDIHHSCMLNRVMLPDEDSVLHDVEGLPTAPAAVRDRLYLHPEIRRGAAALCFIKQHMEKEELFDTFQDDWKYVATVLDRLLFYVYLLVTTFGTIGILMKAPYMLDNLNQNQIISSMLDYIQKIQTPTSIFPESGCL